MKPQLSTIESVVLTGGLGYIGSHAARSLLEKGYRVIIIDNLSTGTLLNRPVNPDCETLIGDFSDPLVLNQAFECAKDHNAPLRKAIHFAAYTRLDESIQVPEKYFENNSKKSARFFKAMVERSLDCIIYSSTAAVYQEQASAPIAESAPTGPCTPYGQSKLQGEIALNEAIAGSATKGVVFRYFNVAGAHPSLDIGQRAENATHLVKVACEAATGQRDRFEIYGDNYPTPDGTPMRDLVHVCDIVEAHLLALEEASRLGPFEIFNIGYGTAFSVLEVVNKIKAISGRDFHVEIKSRRPGDLAAVRADPSKVKAQLGWEPRYADLDAICRTAYLWEEKILKNPKQHTWPQEKS